MTPAELKKLWDKIMEDEDIPWKYTPNCCYSRAHRMAEIAKKLGHKVEKVCVKPKPPSYILKPLGPDGKPLRHPGELGDKVEWSYHVTIVVEVTKPGGKTVKMAIDPALFPGGPVPLDEWLKKVGGASQTKHKKYSADKYQPGNWSDPDGKKTKKRLAEHEASQRAAIIKYINDNPGILDLPRPPVDPTTGGVLCMVNRLSEVRGGVAATVAFTGGVGNLRVPTEWDGGETLGWLRSYGLHEQNPVTIWYSEKTRELAFATPPTRTKVLNLLEGRGHLGIYTADPVVFELCWEHPRVRALRRLVRRGLKSAEDLLFVSLPGGREVIDIVPAHRFDRLIRGKAKKA